LGTKDEITEIAQISFYLAKPNVDFEAVVDWNTGLTQRGGFRQHDFKVGDVACRLLYFETTNHKANPPWLDFVNGQLGRAGPISFRSTSRSPNGILLLAMKGRVFATAFGRSAGASLVRKALEPDFGIKTAMNLCGNEEIRQTRTQNNTLTPTHIDRQVSKPSDTFIFGLSEAEDLKFISAHMKGNANVTLQGRDNLTVKILGDEKLNWDRLIARCGTFLTAYESKAYVDLFPNYRNFKAANEVEILALDALLIDALKAGRFDDIQLCVPEFLSDDEFSFSYTDHHSRENRIYSHLDPRQLRVELKLAEVTVKKLQAKRIYAYSHADDRVLSNKRWPVYDCLIVERKLSDKYFILSDGQWLEVDAAFYASIVDFIENRLRVEPCEDLFKGIVIADNAALKNREGLFNETACRRKPECILFDRAKLRVGLGRKDKEFCDILDFAGDGMVRIINCKPFTGASSVNYLFSQAKFYCEAFLTDDTFLAEIRDHIDRSGSAAKDRYLAHIPGDVRRIKAQDYRVCLWLLYDQREVEPTRNSIPLIAQYELKLMHDHLSRVCKFSDIILRFVPVQMVSFTRKAAPKTEAA
jgi:uncharacterized protein (TIGR04141 family)